MREVAWVFKDLAVETAIECCKKAKNSEMPFMSKVFLKYLKDQGGLNAVLTYLEFLCTECCETKESAALSNCEENDPADNTLIEKWE